MVGERGGQQRQLVGRGRHVRVGEDQQVRVRGEHPGTHRGALAAVRDGHDLEIDPVDPLDLAPRAHDVGGPVRAPIVDDEDGDPLRELSCARGTLPGMLAAPVQVAEQLVEGRSDALRLVIGGEDEGEAGWRRHRREVYGLAAASGSSTG